MQQNSNQTTPSTETSQAAPSVSSPLKKKKRLIVFTAAVASVFVIGGVLTACWAHRSTKTPADNDTLDPVNGPSSTYVDVPQEGSPDDYTPVENLFMSLSQLENEPSFSSKTTGEVVAKVGFIRYTQTVESTRAVTENTVFVESISLSTLKKVAQQQYFQEDAILLRDASGWQDGQPVWSDDMKSITQDAYFRAYGQIPRVLTNYLINSDTVLSAKATGRDENGHYVIEFTLDPEASAVYYRRQVATTGGASEYPTFNSVHMELTIDDNWRPLKLVTSENYSISFPVIGQAVCQGDLVEEFYGYSEAPTVDQSDFEDYMENEYDPSKAEDTLDLATETDPVEMIREILSAQPSYLVEVTLPSGETLPLQVYVDADTMSFQVSGRQADLGDFFAAYADETVYLRLGTQKLSMNVQSLTEAVETITQALGIPLGSSLSLDSSVSLDSLASLDISTLMQGLTMNTDGDQMTVTLDTGSLAGTVLLTAGDVLTLQQADLTIGGMAAHIRPQSGVTWQTLSGYTDLTGVEKLASPLAAALSAKGYEFTVSLTGGGETYQAHVLLARGDAGLSMKLTATVWQLPITVTMIGDQLYVDCEAIHLTGKTSEWSEVIGAALSLAGVDESQTGSFTEALSGALSDLNISQIIQSIQSISFTNQTLSALVLWGDESVALTLSSDTLTVKTSAVFATLKLTKTYPSTPVITANQTSYLALSDLQPLLKSVSKAISARGYTFAVSLTSGGETYRADVVLANGEDGLSLKLTTTIDGQTVTLSRINGVLYATCGAISLQATDDDLTQLVGMLMTLLGKEDSANALSDLASSLEFEGDLPQLVGALKSLRFSKGTLKATLLWNEQVLDIAVTPDTLSVSTTIEGQAIQAVLKLTACTQQAPTLTPPADSVPLSSLLPLAETITSALQQQTYDLSAELAIGDTSYTAAITLVRTEPLSARLTTRLADTDITLLLLDDVVYAQAGNIAIHSSLADVDSLWAALAALLPSDTEWPTVALPDMTTFSFSQLIDSVQALTATKDGVRLDVLVDDTVLTAQLTANSLTVSGLTVGEQPLSLTLTLQDMSGTAATLTTPESSMNATELVELLAGAKATVEAGSWTINASTELVSGDTTYQTDLALTLIHDTDWSAHALLTLDDPAADGVEHTAEVTYLNQDFYLSYNGLKMVIGDSELRAIIASFLDLFGLDDPLLDEWLQVDEDETIDLSMLASYFSVSSDDALESLSLADVLGAIRSATLEDGVLTVEWKANGDVYSLALTGDADGLQSLTLSSVDLDSVELRQLQLAVTAPTSQTVTCPQDADEYMEMNSLNRLLRAFSHTASLSAYQMDGKLNLKVSTAVKVAAKLAGIEIDSIQIDYDVKVRLIDKLVQAQLILNIPDNAMTEETFSKDTSYTTSGSFIKTYNYTRTTVYTGGAAVTTLYMEDGVIYIQRSYTRTTKIETGSTKIKGVVTNWKTASLSSETVVEYRKLTNADFERDAMNQMFYILHLNSSTQSVLADFVGDETGSSSTSIQPEKVLTGYTADESTYTITLSGSELTGTSLFDDIVISITEQDDYLRTLHANTGLLSGGLMEITLTGTLQDPEQEVDMTGYPTDLFADPRYAWVF